MPSATFKIFNLKKIRWKLRCWFLNYRKGVFISLDSFVSKTADFQLNPQDVPLGGTIHISSGATICDGVIIAPYGGSIHIDEGVFIGPYCVIYGHGGVKIGRDSLVATHTVIVSSSHVFKNSNSTIRSQGEQLGSVIIGQDVWIGCGARVLSNTRIGNGCVVGAGAVVNKSIEDYSIAVGVPAKVIAYRGKV